MAQATTATRTKKHVSKRDGANVARTADADTDSQISQMIDRASDFIREQPFQAVGLALGAGYLGRILFRGPLATLAMLGGVGYLGARIAAK